VAAIRYNEIQSCAVLFPSRHTRPNEYQFSVPRTCNAVGEARPDIPVGKHLMDHKMATSFTTSFTDIDFEMVLGGDESRPRIS
jgi:hypothetical protein